MNNNISLLANTEFQEIQPEYVYLTIPAEYVCIYHKLLVFMADLGKDILSDCSAICKDSNKNIISCWNMFQSACVCHALGFNKEANVYIEYIKAQLDLNYSGENIKPYYASQPVAITEDGKLKAILSCGQETKFYADVETGDLYKTMSKDSTEYSIENPYLIAENKNIDAD